MGTLTHPVIRAWLWLIIGLAVICLALIAESAAKALLRRIARWSEEHFGGDPGD